jgi:uncharacterized repeat protein (TIGR02543 family)
MAYGTQVYHWRSYGNWSTSISGRDFKVTLTVGMGSIAWGYNLGVIANANIDGTTKSIRSDFYSATGATVDKNMLTISKTFTRGHSNVNKGLSWSIVNGSGYHNGTSTGSGTITVPAVASHTVTFDDNGGSEGPESTVKWEYESLTIPSKIPTRKNYKFLGWSTSSSSTSAEYEAGKSYDGTKDENYTLYAVWKILYIPPSFSNALALRTASASSTTNNPDGVYCYASFTWNVDTSVYPDNVLNTIDIKYYQDDSTVGTAVTPSGITSGSTGTVNVHFPAALSSVYSIVCIISDTQGGSVSIARSIGSGSIPIEVSNKGQSIGIMSSAPISPGVKIGSSGTPSFEHFAETINGNLNSVARIYGETSSDNQGELTLSTDGFDSSGAISRGTINLLADNVTLNGVNQRMLINVVKKDFFEQHQYSDGLLITYIWFAVNKRDGTNSTTGCSYKKITYAIPYKRIICNLASQVNSREIGYYGLTIADMCMNTATSTVCRLNTMENLSNMWFQGMVIGTWK